MVLLLSWLTPWQVAPCEVGCCEVGLLLRLHVVIVAARYYGHMLIMAARCYSHMLIKAARCYSRIMDGGGGNGGKANWGCQSGNRWRPSHLPMPPLLLPNHLKLLLPLLLLLLLLSWPLVVDLWCMVCDDV